MFDVVADEVTKALVWDAVSVDVVLQSCFDLFMLFLPTGLEILEFPELVLDIVLLLFQFGVDRLQILCQTVRLFAHDIQVILLLYRIESFQFCQRQLLLSYILIELHSIQELFLETKLHLINKEPHLECCHGPSFAIYDIQVNFVVVIINYFPSFLNHFVVYCLLCAFAQSLDRLIKQSFLNASVKFAVYLLPVHVRVIGCVNATDELSLHVSLA